jgi:hypothetical protein
MSASENSDSKRNKIIGLLYIVFICFSVISIKVSLLDSNLYTIRSFEEIFEEENKKINVSEDVILHNKEQLLKIPKAASYLKISKRIEESQYLIKDIIDSLNNQLGQNGKSIVKEFNNRTAVENILKKDKFVPLLKNSRSFISKYSRKKNNQNN